MTFNNQKRSSVLGALKGKLKKYDFIGFDCETITTKNNFYMVGFYYNDIYKAFYNRIEAIEWLISQNIGCNMYIVATNLSFDLLTLFKDTKYEQYLKNIFRGSNIIFSEFKYKNKKIKFIDTTNYIFTSVANLGKMLGVNKKDYPSCFVKDDDGNILYMRKPENNKEIWELEIYNKYDCKISSDFMYFLQNAVNKSGGNLKITSASTCFDIWRRNFLKQNIVKENYVLKKNVKDLIFEAFYGGRTEVYIRGKQKDILGFDINSLYPSVMRLNFPLPQSVKYINKPSKKYLNFNGVTKCKLYCPDNINKPFLPLRRNKVIFPCGSFFGTWNNCELKYAIDTLNYKISDIQEQIIYTNTFSPFKDYVENFYKLRLEYKKQNNQFQAIMKLFLNSLYGKFGERYRDKFEVLKYNGENYEEFVKKLTEEYEEIDKETYLLRSKEEYDGINSFPIIASHVTSYARILMYPYINNDNILYTDTDSIYTTEEIEHSDKLGEMKFEGKYKEAYFLKPKVYYLKKDDKDDKEVVTKIKGVKQPCYEDFIRILDKKEIVKTRFVKYRESLRQNLKVNEIIECTKQIDVNDDKRVWYGNRSIPIKLQE